MTENPIVIMLINMTIVFAVLAILNVFLRIIHLVDPTFKKPEEAKAVPKAAPAPAPAPAPAAPAAPAVAPGIPPETVAAIAAALAAYGVGFSQVKAIRPMDAPHWTAVGHSEHVHHM